MDTEITGEYVSQQLRAIRQAQSLSLSDVEDASKGAIKAVVLGSYERGARSLSVKRAIQIAQFYGVPVSTLFGATHRVVPRNLQPFIIDTRRLRHNLEKGPKENSDSYSLIQRFVLHIQSCRQDWNGEVISVRESDASFLAISMNESLDTFRGWLESEKLLLSFKS